MAEQAAQSEPDKADTTGAPGATQAERVDRLLDGDHESGDTAESPKTRRPLVVGIGASAGGLEALSAFFDTLPPDTGMTFVIVTHLSPNHESILDELLQRHTAMPVIQVPADEVAIAPNHVYICLLYTSRCV